MNILKFNKTQIKINLNNIILVKNIYIDGIILSMNCNINFTNLKNNV